MNKGIVFMKKLFAFLVLPILIISACSSNNQPVEQLSKDSSTAPLEYSAVQQDEPIEIEATKDYFKENKTIYRDNLKIVGELYIPDNDYDVFPLVILSHGFGGNMSSTRNDALTFTKQGFATFVFDFIGGGFSIQSDGQMTEMSVLTEAQDLNAVIDYLLEDERISPRHIFLLGQSQGGFVSTYVAGTRDDIRGLVGFYPAYCIKDDALEQYPNADQVPDPYQMTKMGTTLGKIYYTDVVSFDIYEVMEDIECDAVIIHGTADNVVPVRYAQRAAETIPNCTYLELQGAGHGFSGADNEKAVAAAFTLLTNNLD